MKVLPLLLLLFWSLLAQAAGTRYVMQVDGLACPFCAYGIEKKFRQIEGVEQVAVDLDKGRVTVEVGEGTRLTEPEMIKLFKDAGFTYRSMQEEPM